jgi:hypothetical protein
LKKLVKRLKEKWEKQTESRNGSEMEKEGEEENRQADAG